MNLYDHIGYLDWNVIARIPVPFIFIYGPRGVGKTYGALKHVTTYDIPFLYMRRLHSEYEIIQRPETFPFKKINDDTGSCIVTKSINKYVSGYYYGQLDDKGLYVPEGPPTGYATALSTMANVRGIDLSNIKWWIYDEFIPEAHVRPIKEEGSAFMNAYETMNRNRELSGEDPLKCICLANSNRLANPIFIELGLVTVAEKMKRRNQSFYMDRERGIALIDTFDSPISEKKEATALYKLANKDSTFYKMAIGNTFSDLEETTQVSRPLKEYRPIVAIGEICIYKHKSKPSAYYCCTHVQGSPKHFGTGEIEKARCQSLFSWLPSAYLQNKIEFESYLCEALFNKYIFS